MQGRRVAAAQRAPRRTSGRRRPVQRRLRPQLPSELPAVVTFQQFARFTSIDPDENRTPVEASRSSVGVSGPPEYAPTRSTRSVSMVTSSTFDRARLPARRAALPGDDVYERLHTVPHDSSAASATHTVDLVAVMRTMRR